MKSFLRFFILFTVAFCSEQKLIGQIEATKWYFGAYAALDFSTYPPTTFTNNPAYSLEGCASIADANGNLLFYTNCETVWNSQHQVMQNGTGLGGNNSSTQGALIVKNPGNSTLYYIFTLDWIPNPNGLRYSIVDMTQAGGLGAVTTKSVLIYQPSAEKMTAVKHCNGIDTWLITHELQGNNFRAYLVSASGISNSPVISPSGLAYSDNFAGIGVMKTSPDGKRLATAIWNDYPGTGLFELYDFDNTTGIVSNGLTLLNNVIHPYGVEFSPDASKLYATTNVTPNYFSDSKLYQWDLCPGNTAGILASQYTVHTTTANINQGAFAAIQLAPNGKIYAGKFYRSWLGIVNNPNAAGVACNYVENGQPIGPPPPFNGPYNTYGLPNFITSYFRAPAPQPGITYTNTSCQSTSFSAVQNCNLPNYLTNTTWWFGDPASGPANTATGPNPTHDFSSAGTFTVQQVRSYSCGGVNDTINQIVMIAQGGPPLNGPLNYPLCAGQSQTITSGGATDYSWSTGAITSSIVVTPTATTSYTLTGTDTGNNCSSRMVVSVIVDACTFAESTLLMDRENARIYPNPSEGSLIIETTTEGSLKLYNGLGQIICEKPLGTGKHTLATQTFGNGIFFAEITTGQNVYRQKLIFGKK